MSKPRIVWSDDAGDLRKKKTVDRPDISVDEKNIELKIRRLTSGKGRTVIEITGLPQNKKWCQQLAKDIKKLLGVGGTYKDKGSNKYIEIHGEKIEKVMQFLDSKSLRWKKIGG